MQKHRDMDSNMQLKIIQKRTGTVIWTPICNLRSYKKGEDRINGNLRSYKGEDRINEDSITSEFQ